MDRARAAVPRIAVGPLVAVVALALPAPAGALAFRLPVPDPSRIWTDMVLHVDHDPQPGAPSFQCLAFNGAQGFPNCYNGHDGTDLILDGGFPVMDAGSMEVVAGAAGKVVDAVDGNYDRCHGDITTGEVDCDGHPMHANFVALEHEGGYVTWYYHLKKGSVAVQVGDEVACGQALGLIGSSGISAMPHVHFELHDASGLVVDPFAGPVSQPQSFWTQQEDPATGLPWVGCEGEVPPPVDPGPGDLGAPDAAPEAGLDAGGGASEEAQGPDTGVGEDALALEDVAASGDLSPGADLAAADDLVPGFDAAAGADPSPGTDLSSAVDAASAADPSAGPFVPPGGASFGCAAGGPGSGAWAGAWLLAYALGALISRRIRTSSRIRSSGIPG